WPEIDPRELARDLDTVLWDPIADIASYVAVAPDRSLVGLIELSIRAYAEGCETDRVGYVEGWYVAPAWRRRGVGRALMAAGETWARGAGCVEFASDALLENGRSHLAHRALGFQEVERIVCFRKPLPGPRVERGARGARAEREDGSRWRQGRGRGRGRGALSI
ncbi:MAG TPA: GNAT family N-acetyltransferase, partial [Candidatus Eisenbacteria bacterium]